jgi:rhamnogalacturonyl hydrolase YesR
MFDRFVLKAADRKSYILSMILLAVLMPLLVVAQELPPKDTILKQMTSANRYFMDKWPDPGADIITDKVRPSNIWTRATYYEGLMAFYTVNDDASFYQYAVDWGKSHSWKPAYGGITRNADDQCCGQTYIELYLLDNRPERIQPIKSCIDSMVNSAKSDDWWWIDALQMAMPIFARLGVLMDDTAYFSKMHDLYHNTKNEQGGIGLYNPVDHLWWRDWSFLPPYTTPNGKNCYWSRGNGWVFAALARVLDVLPENAVHRQEYIDDFRNMAGAIIEIQREDGFWNPSLVDPDHYGGKETSGTAFFTYGLAWGINHQILDKDTYKPFVTRAWNGMVKNALHPNGFLGYVQGTGKQPSDGQPLSYDKPANFEDFGLGAFLLAGSEVYHLAPDTATGGAASIVSPESSENVLFRVYPNPAKDKISIYYNLQLKTDVSISLLDICGRFIKVFYEQPEQDAGEYSLLLDFTNQDGNISSGDIFYQTCNKE